MDRYAKVLRRCGLKVTAPRLEIMRYLDGNEEHPKAERIYKDLKRTNVSLSKTTVYNTLDLLRKRGVVHAVITEDGIRYEMQEKPHQHFICRGCKAIIEVEGKGPEVGTLLMGLHRVDEFHAHYTGLCHGCLGKGATCKGRSEVGRRGRRPRRKEG